MIQDVFQGIYQRCLRGVSGVSDDYFRGVSEVFQWLFQACLMSVSYVLQVSFKVYFRCVSGRRGFRYFSGEFEGMF